jgi:frataxin
MTVSSYDRVDQEAKLAKASFFRCVIGYNAFKHEAEFKLKVADMFWSLGDALTANFESKIDDFAMDVQDDALSLIVKDAQFLLSRQCPTRQIWASTPVSGSLKFDYDSDTGRWVDTRDTAIEMKSRIEEEIRTVINRF